MEASIMSRIITPIVIVFIMFGMGLSLILIMGIFWSRTEHGQLDYKAAIILKLRGEGRERVTPKTMRRQGLVRAKFLQKRSEEMAKIQDITIPGPAGALKIRLYHPSQKENLPVLIYYHGGGWVMGNLETHDTICRQFASQGRVIVAAVDYRLAPENPYPAAFDDSYAALEWVYDNVKRYGGDPSRIALGGDSAGGNLAAAVAIKARDALGPRISYQVLLYPVTNPGRMETESHVFFANGYGLTRAHMVFFREAYLPEKADRLNPYASPLLAKDLRDLPPAIIITAGFDVLRDEGLSYAERLGNAGNWVETIHYPSMIHGFASMGRLFQESGDAVSRVAKSMKKRFH